MNLNDCLDNYEFNNDNIKNYHKIVELTFFSIGFVSIGGITFYYIRNKLGNLIRAKIVDGIWSLLKLETITRMSFNKLRNSINNTLINPFKMFVVNEEVEEPKDVSYYMDGRLVKKLTYLDAIKYQPTEEYNLIIYKIQGNLVNCEGKTFYKIFERHEDINETCEPSQLKFISIEILIDGLDQKLSLNLGDINVFIQGNKIFTRPFMKWFLMEKYGINLKQDTNYTIYTIDNQINMDKFEINNNVVEYAVISENGYDKEIINNSLENIREKIVVNEDEDITRDVKVEVVAKDENNGGIMSNIIYSWFGYR
jgi:hypothetical protein